jgi:hypothetical protein
MSLPFINDKPSWYNWEEVIGQQGYGLNLEHRFISWWSSPCQYLHGCNNNIKHNKGLGVEKSKTILQEFLRLKQENKKPQNDRERW